jgi:hypothetical protein
MTPTIITYVYFLDTYHKHILDHTDDINADLILKYGHIRILVTSACSLMACPRYQLVIRKFPIFRVSHDNGLYQ